ncbi:uncharacterized protein LOC122870041 isoform X2 [Siniperca chuatsi]|uniref:uncharacterized protein LOC122870041 isoform X2 n=1 Tax=Siniperca chuatsi TaxID=119488 RepID=UPI001CE14E51|nr:uncharacterized protein LOC122870041 isoform X2 [Siniperca chuatsi]
MRSFLLLLLPLMKGCEAGSIATECREGLFEITCKYPKVNRESTDVVSEESEVKGCPKGWVEFTWKYPKTNRNYQSIDIQCAIPKETTIQSTQKNVWENKGSVSLYHDTKNKNLRVVIKQLKPEDSGKYKCNKHGRSQKTDEVELEVEKDGCQSQLIQTAYKTAKTTITCDYTENKSMFFCKENGLTCEDILSTKSSVKSNRIFTLTETKRGFNMSISYVSSQHAGVYWCGVVLNKGNSRVSRKQIQLEVKDITTFKRSPTTGQNLTYWCKYENGTYINKFICKGEDPSICQPLVSAAQQNNTGKFSMKEDKEKSNSTITVRDVTPDDTGTYWCGAESTDKTRSNTFFHRFVMTVVSTTVSTTSSTSPVSSIQSTTASTESRGSFPVLVTVIICVAVLLLLFVLIFILIYKRSLDSTNTRNGAAAQHIKELRGEPAVAPGHHGPPRDPMDYVYEEIQQHVQKPDSGNAMNTIYATANFPTNPSDSLHYSSINFQSSSGRAGGEALILKPSSAACEYSTVKYSQSPTYSTVNQPSRSSQDPLYSTVNKPQSQ